MTTAAVLLITIACAAALVAAVYWRKRQRQRLLSHRESAHLVRQAQHLCLLAQTVVQLECDRDIAIILLRLGQDTLSSLQHPGEINQAEETRANIDQLLTQLEHGTHPALPELSEADHAHLRLQLTDATRLLHRACRKGLIDRNQREKMSQQLQEARLQAEIGLCLRQGDEALAANDPARARACYSQARKRLEQQPDPTMHRPLSKEIEQRLLRLDESVLRSTGDI